MGVSQLKLVYDVTLVKNGFKKHGLRSGIFFVIINTLREFLKRDDVDLTLTCNASDFLYIEDVLNNEFLGTRFKFKIDRALNIYDKVKYLSKSTSREGKVFEKICFKLLSFVCFPVYKLCSFGGHKLGFEEYDAFLSPAYLISNSVKTKKYIILHDLIPLLLPEYKKRDWKEGGWLYDLCKTLNHNDYYFTNSEYTRKDFLKYFPQIDSEKITTALLACNEKFKQDLSHVEEVKKKYNIPADMKYVFSLCSPDPRKNLLRSTRTFLKFLKKNDIKDMVFVLGGGENGSFLKKLYEEIENFGDCNDRIIKIGYVDDEDLPTLYSGAEWFTYTSQYEGFGLPPLEAMSCGCPVITSNTSSLPEVVGDAGISIDWDSDDQHIEAYEKYYFDSALRKLNREKGLVRAKKFSWEKCAEIMIETMKKNRRGK